MPSVACGAGRTVAVFHSRILLAYFSVTALDHKCVRHRKNSPMITAEICGIPVCFYVTLFPLFKQGVTAACMQ